MSRLALFMLLSLVGYPAAQAADDVTIYRCTDAAGHLTLRDTPCRDGQKQQTRTMLRPRDAPIVRTPRPAPSGVPASAPARVVVVQAPRPLYECITPDGDAYTSESGEGSPRWVPLWTLGYPGYAGNVGLGYPGAGSAGAIGDTRLSITHGGVHIDSGRTVLSSPPPFYAGIAAYGAGTWIRDQCHALPQDEVCARLLDRRDEIRRRFFNAMPTERDVLRVEERGVNARLGNDCGTY